jgi:hypothetical protein
MTRLFPLFERQDSRSSHHTSPVGGSYRHLHSTKRTYLEFGQATVVDVSFGRFGYAYLFLKSLVVLVDADFYTMVVPSGCSLARPSYSASMRVV